MSGFAKGRPDMGNENARKNWRFSVCDCRTPVSIDSTAWLWWLRRLPLVCAENAEHSGCRARQVEFWNLK
jgi:hypothetical protein